ncbi:MAG: glycosyltransferase [Gemmatimonadales bacterium]|nr:glycosyltransferase [Gemmatimonadales bacterium]
MDPVELTVVVPSVNGLYDLMGCLEAVERMRDSVRLEVLVVDRLGDAVRDAVRARFPDVRILPVARETTIPEMRHLAFAEAQAEAVAVIEDHVLVPPDWGSKLLAGLAAGHDVVGGPIANAADQRLLDWSTFLCEYSACLPPLPEGKAAWLPGNNIVYRRALLARSREVTAEGKWENRLHEAMQAEGIALHCDATLIVGHKKHFGFLEYNGQRYLYSRSYAGARVREAPRSRRVMMGLAAFALPPLLLARILRTNLGKGVSPVLVATTLPFIVVYVSAWAVGEIVGYWFGAGDSLARVR